VWNVIQDDFSKLSLQAAQVILWLLRSADHAAAISVVNFGLSRKMTRSVQPKIKNLVNFFVFRQGDKICHALKNIFVFVFL
jgi:hypothetical protein